MLNLEGLEEARCLLLSRYAAENFEWKMKKALWTSLWNSLRMVTST